ncbi:MAG: hypothetical protein ACTSYD_05840 [Candidatus Heimdallarchaeaceae archaeon]
MILQDPAANAVILRNVIDFSTKSNQFLLTNLSRVLPDIINEPECYEAPNVIDITEGLELLQRKKKLTNIDIAYIVLLAIRGYKFHKVAEMIYLCEDDAVNPSVDKMPLGKLPKKPKLGDKFEIKTAILKEIIESVNKDSETIIRNLIRSVPDLIERQERIAYSGRYLTISEWIVEKESKGQWVSDEVFRINDTSLMPWTFANLIVLQTRGYFLQEVPGFRANDYVFTIRD